ncbi:MAG: hypothetical protein IH984_14865 [Planctomycetes bacterium]|nr:hypothetical protein [Planctomycetota bacterium]
MAAAVADFRPKTAVLDAKLNRTKNPLNLELEPTPDLIQLISSKRQAPPNSDRFRPGSC